jgi:preprotein translocase subunit SecG
MLEDFLLVVNMLVCIALIGVVLLQRSEGGAFGGGSPTGLVTARGAGDLLTRTTWVLFSMFLALSLALTLIGGHDRSSQSILDRLKNTSINPDQLAHPAPPPTTAPATAPVQAPSLALPPVSAPTHAQPAEHAARKSAPIINAPPPATTPSPPILALPPIGGAQRGQSNPQQH